MMIRSNADAASARHRGGLDSLTATSVALVLANALHTADHVRQGFAGLDWQIVAGGTALSALVVASLVLTLRRDDAAPLLATATGLVVAGGVAASHLAPRWSALSDPYPAIHADLLSWTVMLAELGAALLVAVAGTSALVSRRRLASR
jgi:hypothetical protein